MEVPAPLRLYRGGRDLRTALDLPGIVPIPEMTFPTARFERLQNSFARASQGDVDRLRHGMAGHLLTYARQADMVRRFARNLFGTTLRAGGEDAALLQEIGLDLADGLLPRFGPARVDSAHVMDRETSPGELIELLAALRHGVQEAGMAYSGTYPTKADRPAVWDHVEGMRAQDPVKPAVALGAIALQASTAARVILDNDRRHAAALIGSLRQRHAGNTFDAEDFAAAAVESGINLAPAEWRSATSLPGFVASDAQIGRLEDAADGARRYQARLHVRNTESVPGRVSVSADWYGMMAPSIPVLVDAGTSVEIDWIGSEPHRTLWLHSYLSLNRHPVPIVVTHSGDAERQAVGGPFGVRPSEWLPEHAGVVVDDLDARFSAGTQPVDREAVDFDHGLPVYMRFETPMAESRWYRESVPSAWGRHRGTVAVAHSGDGDLSAVFAAELPHEGLWHLDYHIPPVSPPYFPRGTPRLRHISWIGENDMAIRTAGAQTRAEFDGAAAQPGWNEIGTFEVGPGRVDVVVTNRTDGEIVVADAVRWREAR